MMQGQGEPSIEKETGSTALVNGNNLLGPVSAATELMCFYVVFTKQVISSVPDKCSRYQVNILNRLSLLKSDKINKFILF